ncbi:3-dehydroquinate synthase [Aquiflexum gelatinilyticum]|uniref:3-dehydroquinate synthase n=1 Tax=Aquiflexum gelatinilyticum TaxID=2961943 RepID=A0A9X2PC57_9BACT|nr:3-dehydroquinate synthase [Aquiflexum gelatinilyticum]MCR9016015.1 3-dehydroquinate synthase [Aquiflexum gelatinilyticum]
MEKIIEQTFTVPFRYQVCFLEGIFNVNNPMLADFLDNGKKAKAFFVVDSGVSDAFPNLLNDITEYAKAYENKFLLNSEPLVVPGGEISKNDETIFKKIVDATSIYGIDRHSYIVGIGGGAVLDMVGFAAAISHRGIRHIRIPTTVLSQNDSGVGVKNGINSYGKKNYLGTFAPPYAVINDFNFLTTLDDRDWRSGISEAIKVALIKDLSFFEWLEKHADQLANRVMEPMQELIIKCAQMHMNHIAGKDPFETGSARPLDFGHWAAHKLEHLTHYQVRHGEAVAIGIALDSTYSYLKGMISQADLMRIINLIKTLGFEIYHPELSGQALLKGLEEFREHLGGELTITLLESMGKGVEVHQMDNELILKSIDQLKLFHQENLVARS